MCDCAAASVHAGDVLAMDEAIECCHSWFAWCIHAGAWLSYASVSLGLVLQMVAADVKCCNSIGKHFMDALLRNRMLLWGARCNACIVGHGMC